MSHDPRHRRAERAEGLLRHIEEYWNGSYNERAMSDALDHIVSGVAAHFADAGEKS